MFVFSGIIESISTAIDVQKKSSNLRMVLERPQSFTDIKTGDSIATNGVCLTVEAFTDSTMTFTLGEETLSVTGWNEEFLLKYPINLERSLRLGDRMHGHWVSGHVDTIGYVTQQSQDESWLLDVQIPRMDSRYIWSKGCVAINGVSLTINKVQNKTLSFCLIPETIDRTNFKSLPLQAAVNIEYDYWTKAFVNYQENREIRV